MPSEAKVPPISLSGNHTAKVEERERRGGVEAIMHILERGALVIPQRVKHHARVDLFAAHLPARLLPPLPRGGHAPAPDEDDLLVLAVALGVAVVAAVAQEVPDGLLEHADPPADGGRALGRVAQVARHLADAETRGGAVLSLLPLALGLQLGRLVLDALPEPRVPELGDLVGDDLDRVGRVDFPVAGERGLDIGDADETVWR